MHPISVERRVTLSILLMSFIFQVLFSLILYDDRKCVEEDG